MNIALSKWGVIDHVPVDRVTLATSGRGGEFDTPYGVIDMTHYQVFSALDRGGFLDQLVFQGGTSLHLCYGAPRFNEDLDFAGGRIST